MRAVALILLFAAAVGQAQPLPRAWVPHPFDPASGYCWVDVRVFETLRHGPFGYCRQKLRYTPGKPECFQITDQVCVSLLPNGLWGVRAPASCASASPAR